MYVLPPARKPLPYSLDERNRRYVPLLIGLALTLLIGGLFAALVMPLSPRRMAQPSADLIPALPLWSFVAGLPLTVPRDGPALAAPLATQSEMKAENTLGALGLGGLREALVRLGQADAQRPEWRGEADAALGTAGKAAVLAVLLVAAGASAGATAPA